MKTSRGQLSLSPSGVTTTSPLPLWILHLCTRKHCYSSSWYYVFRKGRCTGSKITFFILLVCKGKVCIQNWDSYQIKNLPTFLKIKKCHHPPLFKSEGQIMPNTSLPAPLQKAMYTSVFGALYSLILKLYGLMPCPSMGPKWFWTVQIILVKYKLFRTGPICFGRTQIILGRSKL